MSTGRWVADTGRQILTDLLLLSDKDPKDFLIGYEDMMNFLQDQNNWPAIQKELEQRQVKAMTFYDVVLDFIILDAFKDLDSPPASVKAVCQNRFLSNGFKETVCLYNIYFFFYAMIKILILMLLFYIIGINNCCMVSLKNKKTYVKVSKWIYGTFLYNFRTNFTINGMGFLWIR